LFIFSLALCVATWRDTTVFGTSALAFTTTGSYDTVIGNSALFSNS
jgi:hypothetical protein